MHGLLCVELFGVLDVESARRISIGSLYASHNLHRREDVTDLRKSQSSAAASISACHAFLPCPSMVAAISSCLYFPLIKSAALRNIAALSSKGVDSHHGLTASADSIAASTCSSVALEDLATMSA